MCVCVFLNCACVWVSMLAILCVFVGVCLYVYTCVCVCVCVCDVCVQVKDVLLEPVWKTHDATHFKKVKMGDQKLLEACSPGDPVAFQATLQSLAAEGKAHLVHTPLITIRDFDRACERARPTVSEADLGIHQKFTDEFGEEG
uniref:Spastin/Vps4 C-terminal domain-containing protein n=1 Tax=Tetraselmis chuii TaxID=63592 RepID=A0A7S1SHI6_9CHLO|mmetsp:Transcript_12218/g.21933  ORF Transcript_12218/g.21933 Transcript_12218/m.21933 type:complete len:143 (+) Transcript_12218:123-551(+)